MTFPRSGYLKCHCDSGPLKRTKIRKSSHCKESQVVCVCNMNPVRKANSGRTGFQFN